MKEATWTAAREVVAEMLPLIEQLEALNCQLEALRVSSQVYTMPIPFRPTVIEVSAWVRAARVFLGRSETSRSDLHRQHLAAFRKYEDGGWTLKDLAEDDLRVLAMEDKNFRDSVEQEFGRRINAATPPPLPPAVAPAVRYAKAATVEKDVDAVVEALLEHLTAESVDDEEPALVKAFFEKNAEAATPNGLFAVLCTSCARSTSGTVSATRGSTRSSSGRRSNTRASTTAARRIRSATS